MRKIVLYGVIILQILLIASLLRGIQVSQKSNERLDRLVLEKAKLQEEYEKIKQEKEYVESDFYLEKVARDELHLSKPGERVVIVPQEVVSSVRMQTLGDSEVELSNWQKWWRVLAGKY